MMMLHNSREINLVDSVVDAIYTSFAEMALAKPIEIQEIPEGADEETTDKIKEANEKATETNKQIEINQKKVSLRVVDQPYDTSDESAFIKLNNIHEEDPAAQAQAAAEQPAEGASPSPDEANAPASPAPASHFDPEKIPTKIPLVKTKVETPGTKLHGIKKDEEAFKVAVYHSEAAYAVRKFFIDAAKKHFVELEKAETSAIEF